MHFSFSRVFPLACLVGLSACNGNDANLPGNIQAEDQAVQTPVSIPTGDPSTPSAPAPQPTSEPAPDSNTVGGGCQSSDSNHYCLGLKYVVYTDDNGSAVIPQATAISNLASMNKTWSQCDIAFQIDEYVQANPADYGLQFEFGAGDFSEMDLVRRTLQDKTHLLVVTTGKWNHNSSSANAWTAMPGDGVYGAILESEVADYPNIIAHELGHYLSLGHANDQSNLMNPVIYSTSTKLTSSDCSAARDAVDTYWKAMLR